MKRISTTEAAQNRRLEEARNEGFEKGVEACVKALRDAKFVEAATHLAYVWKVFGRP